MESIFLMDLIKTTGGNHSRANLLSHTAPTIQPGVDFEMLKKACSMVSGGKNNGG